VQIVVRPALALLCGAVLLSSGCVQHDTYGDRHVIGHAWWVSAGFVGLGAGFALAGIVTTLRKGFWNGVVLLACAVGILGLVVPKSYLEQVVITQAELDSTTGWWFAPTRYHIQFEQVRQVEVLPATKTTRRGTKRIFTLRFIHQDESVVILPHHDLLEQGLETLKERLKEHHCELTEAE
jgi:hypothetical protein